MFAMDRQTADMILIKLCTHDFCIPSMVSMILVWKILFSMSIEVVVFWIANKNYSNR